MFPSMTRVEIANNAHVDVLLSVHNNSLPDGRDPLNEHGTSSYWYHPQSIGLAHAVNNGMVHDVGFPDFGSRFQNLALTRPSGMLACLAEVGFVINQKSTRWLITPRRATTRCRRLAQRSNHLSASVSARQTLVHRTHQALAWREDKI